MALPICGGIYIHAGPEIGVASTKAFTCQMAALALLTLRLGRLRALSVLQGREIVRALRKLPGQMTQLLSRAAELERIAEQFARAPNALYLGRGYNFPVALEGALKLKEISYIHAEGYPAAEIKHGPIALIDEMMPVVFIAPAPSTDAVAACTGRLEADACSFGTPPVTGRCTQTGNGGPLACVALG